MANLTFTTQGAIVSEDGLYRYLLWRQWNPSQPSVLFLMLNPSTADENRDDPTVRRCIAYAKQWGYGALEVGNIFALRSTNPQVLYGNLDPVGPKNDDHLILMHERATLTVCAWGVHGALNDRGDAVADMLRRSHHFRPNALHCLGETKDGHPRHPLYLPRNAEPRLYQGKK